MPFLSLSGISGGIASKLLGDSIDPFSASGGTELEPGDGFKYHVFLEPGNFVVHSGTGHAGIKYLIVAAGGGGGSAGGTYDGAFNYRGGSGGGGAGGVLTGTTTITGATTYPIAVGSAAGPAGIARYTFEPNKSGYENQPGQIGLRGGVGGDSSFNSMTALGGGGGGGWWGGPPTQYPSDSNPSQRDGGPGGSGGGGGGTPLPPYNGQGGSGTPGQGYAGGEGGDGPGPLIYPGGGGGGAGGAGNDAPATSGPGGAGGPALAVPEFPAPAIEPAIPAPVRPSWTPQVGSTGLYGKGGSSQPGSGGTDYTGNGGGGRVTTFGIPGTTGGDGIVIVKYPV